MTKKKVSGALVRKAPRPPKNPKALALNDGRCIARVKTCKKCGYRYIRGDKAWTCPKCGTDRRCPNKAIRGTAVCGSHGANNDGEQAGAKYIVAHQILDGYNRIMSDPNLLNLTTEIAIVSARSAELQQMIDKLDNSGAHEELSEAVNRLEGMLYEALAENREKQRGDVVIGRSELVDIIRQFKGTLDPIRIENNLWDKLLQTFRLTDKLQDTERKWAVSNEGLVPVVLVLEVLLTIQRISMKYIRNPDDRAAYGKEFRDAIPIEAVARM